VLNAFRHQRKEHKPTAPRRTPIFWCSTPFGINGRNTGRKALAVVNRKMCSTPFGINGRNTFLRLSLHSVMTSAQRLSASTEGTPSSTVLQPLARYGAQRLSASTEGTQKGRTMNEDQRLVLNAFRHQRKEHPVRSLGRRTARDRAQRLSASTEGTLEGPPGCGKSARCSTPFGINGRNTNGRRRPGPAAAVLNAFRHQRKEHLPPPPTRLIRPVLNAFRHQRKEHQHNSCLFDVGLVCSTPFGINGRNTRSHLVGCAAR